MAEQWTGRSLACTPMAMSQHQPLSVSCPVFARILWARLLQFQHPPSPTPDVRRRLQRRIRLLPVLLSLVLALNLSGCLKRITGTYRDSNNVVSLDFHRDGKVYAKVFGVPMVGDYEEKGDKIIFKGAEGDMFIDIIDVDTLSMSHPLSSFTGEIRLKRQK